MGKRWTKFIWFCYTHQLLPFEKDIRIMLTCALGAICLIIVLSPTSSDINIISIGGLILTAVFGWRWIKKAPRM
ncbi:MAG: hypothetical protein COW88_03040 [Candidatus Lloydbacteria bacterium CG22_combo_CG10-13_8_21_14_all_47_15]|uniref:Uncharacterized protein n=1 Tax=Candidatus Lloydbacteria bacterium CG22_combo_CG10-13_8_21_14_all_47_15 TaxID=1974635 RepID=A0A2H0CT55_9BACT|nr:MAG: hypothetical protein COW88_03040 [Candidatus Lloydbacteria bacterium CG22_combo_CG10-13_8_21_14_all_47_15]